VGQLVKLEFHDTDTNSDTDILARILANTSYTRDFLKYLWQAERHADILATILARMSARMSVSVSVSASWNASLTNVYYCKTADSIEMPFKVVGSVGSMNHVVDGAQIHHSKEQFWGGGYLRCTMCTENAASAVLKTFRRRSLFQSYFWISCFV